MRIYWVFLVAGALSGPVLAQTSLQQAGSAWNECLRSSAAHFARSTNESADNIIVAAFGVCNAEERVLRDTWIAEFGVQASIVDMERAKSSARERLMATIFRERMGG